MSGHYLSGEIEKCESCNGRGYSASEGHPDCRMCSGAGYVEVVDENEES